MMKKFTICDVNVSAINLNSAIGFIDGWIKSRQKTYVCVAPVSTIVDCQKDERYKSIVNKADMVTPDGMPVVWLGRSQGFKEVNRTYGPDLMLLVSEKGQALKYRHYFYGGTQTTCEILFEKLKQQFPDINIVGHYSPDKVSLDYVEKKEVIDCINNAHADILWVGLGSPKQDYWMANHRDQLNVPVIIGVGAAFDFLSGQKKQAPRWMQRSGLEWFFRLCSEPKRLWKRYLIGNTLFIYFLIKSWFTGKPKVSVS